MMQPTTAAHANANANATDVNTPRHVAIIMDGNGRWALQRNSPRAAGHRAGVEAVRRVVRHCGELGVQALTLFAFSSENWRRPRVEVNLLMELFLHALQEDVEKLHENGICIRFIGAREDFTEKLQAQIQHAEQLTCGNRNLQLSIAVNYGGRWDILQAAQRAARALAAGEFSAEQLDEARFSGYLSLHELAEPDLLIRTSGEQRLSNYLLWQMAYTELYFTETFWPDFDRPDLERALAWYSRCQRRYGKTAEQLDAQTDTAADEAVEGDPAHG